MLTEIPLHPLPEATRDPTTADLVDGCVAAARGAISANTERALRSDLGIYAAWCGAYGLAAVPASPTTVAAFIDAMAAVRAPATVRRYVASVAAAHRAVGRGRIFRSATVRHALQRMHRAKGRRQEQAQGLTWPLRQRLVEACGTALIDLRDRALVAVAYDGMLRRSELSALQVDDLVEEMGGDATLLVRRSKTDQEGVGDIVYLAPDTVGMAREWLAQAEIAGGRLFRSLQLGRPPGAQLDASQIPRILKRMARRAGLPDNVADGLSGHSARVGAAQDMIASGIELPAILQAGRWRTTAMVNRYGDRLLARRSGAAQLARAQGRV
ncbi:MAG: tyrosine-type recombinase/integrase [Chloroflexi bacterium]|nr:tyrosine-type recombinase/integrase [Chloroflexota bacterium]